MNRKDPRAQLPDLLRCLALLRCSTTIKGKKEMELDAGRARII